MFCVCLSNISGLISVTELGAQAIIYELASVAYMVRTFEVRPNTFSAQTLLGCWHCVHSTPPAPSTGRALGREESQTAGERAHGRECGFWSQTLGLSLAMLLPAVRL